MSNPNTSRPVQNVPEFTRGKSKKVWETDEDYMNSKLEKLKRY